MSQLTSRAEGAVKKRNYPYAIELYIEELKVKPENTEARAALRACEIKVLQNEGKTSGGMGAFLKGFGSYMKAALGMLTKKWDKVLISCEEFLKNDPQNVKVLAWLGKAAGEAGYTETAILTFENIVSINRKNVAAHRALGRLFEEAGDIEKAQKSWQRVKKHAPGDGEADKMLRDLAASSSLEKASDAHKEGSGTFRDLIKDKDQSARLEEAGQNIRTKEQAEAALGKIEEQIASDSSNSKLWQKKGDILVKAGDIDSAIKAYKEGLSHNESDAVLSNKIGDLKVRKYDEKIDQLKASGDKEGLKKLRGQKVSFCIKEWNRRVKEAPTDYGLRYELGRHLYKGGQPKEAIAELQQAINDPRRKKLALNLLGKCFAKQGMLDLAIKRFEEARSGIDSGGDTFKDITYNIGLLHVKQNKSEDAISEFQKILDVDINYRDVMERVESLQK